MRFKKGSKVEVMNKETPPQWCIAEIISGNGHSYNVKYNGYKGVQKVSRKFLRPYQEEDDSKFHNRKRSSPFCSSLYTTSQKVKEDSQRYISCHSYKKVDHANEAYYNTSYKNGDESESDQCSVGSCSVHSGTENVSSDGDSLNTSNDDVAVSIHRLELHAYRSTLEALYASGPLSWEKEALLTNLRINLHISNDEHLIELRHLISSQVN